MSIESELAGATGLKKIVESCFSSVFEEINLSSEAWFQEKNLSIGPAKKKYADYLARRVGTFQLFATNRTVSIDQSYIDIALSQDIERLRYKSERALETSVSARAAGDIRADLDRNAMSPLAALTQYESNLALEGNPGSGKTTALRYVALEAAKGRSIRGRQYLPLFVAVREIGSSETSIHAALVKILSDLQVPEPNRVLVRLLQSGHCLLLVDGLDETDLKHQRALVAELIEFSARYSKALICISARPLSLDVGLPGFAKWETLPFDLEQRREFTKKWFSLVDSKKGERLLEQCSKQPAILDLGSNPLMLSIVCALFENELEVPTEQDELYARCLEGLLGGWDAFRNISRQTLLAKLSLRKRVTHITWMAAEMFEVGKVVFSADDVLASDVMNKVSTFLGTDPLEVDTFLKSLYNDFGILVERSPSRYTFCHLSLQEYAAARYYVENRAETKLVANHFDDPRWREIIRLSAKMLPNADSFIQQVQQAVRLHDRSDVDTLSAVLSAQPSMSTPVRLALYRELARTVAAAISATGAELEVYENQLFLSPPGQEWRGVVQQARRLRKLMSEGQFARAEMIEAFDRGAHKSESKRNGKSKKTKRDNTFALRHGFLVVTSLEPLVKIIQRSGFSSQELLEVKFLRTIESAGSPVISNVTLINRSKRS